MDAAVLSAAVDLLGEVGYARLTMDQVAARAGVSKASLYLRWPNKVALVADAIGYRARPVPEAPDTGSLPADMRIFLLALVDTVASKAGSRAMAAVSGEITTNPELRKAARRGLEETITATVRTILTRAVTRGDLPSSTDVELLSALPHALLRHWWAEHGRYPDAAVVDRIVDQFYRPHPSR